ncbi:hypothetical protein L486_02874 [Kwoniella mangroviensis CBS 10435]|uniref:CSC1/OSCA1-like 7TM region domain-containing protein n=1 Tax=Kwoniella mangroviensis CBS 10435 TaxID=1331196 RepID=A0A1B9IXN6_9TREE|nr:hypothetical protein L486_02874 [Kwoniella mangroviensis CBS 10435]
MHLPRQYASTIANPTASEANIGGVSAADLIQQAERHWDVSATSILAAWVACMAGILLILLLYSTVRLKWRRIYLPRWKLRKPSQLKAEKEEDRLRLAQMSRRGQKEYLMKKFKEEPEYYPGFIKKKDPGDEKGYIWVEKEDDGVWIGKAPKAPINFFGWIKPNWEDTMTELMAILPKWFCCCWSLLGLRLCVWKRGQKKRKTILEQDIRGLRMLGECLDAVIYLMFLRLLKYLFAVISILAVCMAFANYYINTETIYGSTNALSSSSSSSSSNNSADNNTKFDKENMTNIIDNPNLLTAANIKSNGLLVHVSFEIIVTMLVIIFVLKACTHHARLVKEWAKMNRNEISFKTLFITNLSISKTTTTGAKKQITNLVLGENLQNIPCEVWFAMHKLNPLEKRIEKFKKEAFSKAIEAVAMETFYEGQEGQRNHVYDSCWDRVMGRSKLISMYISNEALQEKHQIEEVQELIRYEQDGSNWKDLNGTVTAAFVTLPTARQAKTILSQKKGDLAQAGYTLQKAPRTHNVLWKNLEKDAKAKHSSAIFGKVALIFVCFLNTIPVMGIVFLTNIGILKQMQEDSQFWKVVFMIIEGVLPAAVAAIFAYFLPYIMRELNMWSGSITRGHLDKDQIRQVFTFLLVSNFVVFGLIGVLYETISGIYSKIGEESIGDIYKSIGDLPAKITRAYISQSLYWFSWYPIRSIVMWLQLLQVPRLILKTPQLLKFKTPQDLAEVTLAIHFELGKYSFLLPSTKVFMICLSLIYAPLAPIVVIGATIHFWSAHIVHSQALKFVNDTKETDGECWWVIINRLLVGTVFMQCLMVLTVTLKTQSPPMAVAAALPIFWIVLFKLYLNKHYKDDNLNILYDGQSEFGQGEQKVLEKYVPDILRYDWMPRGKTVKNRKLMERAKQKIPGLKELMMVDTNNSNTGGKLRQKRRMFRKKN